MAKNKVDYDNDAGESEDILMEELVEQIGKPLPDFSPQPGPYMQPLRRRGPRSMLDHFINEVCILRPDPYSGGVCLDAFYQIFCAWNSDRPNRPVLIHPISKREFLSRLRLVGFITTWSNNHGWVVHGADLAESTINTEERSW